MPVSHPHWSLRFRGDLYERRGADDEFAAHEGSDFASHGLGEVPALAMVGPPSWDIVVPAISIHVFRCRACYRGQLSANAFKGRAPRTRPRGYGQRELQSQIPDFSGTT